MPEYILLLHQTPPNPTSLSPEEMQAMYQRYRGWRESLAAKGLNPGGRKLRDGSSRTMKNTNGKTVVTDGPYTETREIIRGFFTFTADSFDHAVEITRDCPHLEFGTIEIREIEV